MWKKLNLIFQHHLQGLTARGGGGSAWCTKKKIPNHWILGASEKMSRSEVLHDML